MFRKRKRNVGYILYFYEKKNLDGVEIISWPKYTSEKINLKEKENIFEKKNKLHHEVSQYKRDIYYAKISQS